MPVIDHAHRHLAVSVPEVPLIFDADKVRLTQTLANLLTNAAKYTNPAGKMWLSAWPEGDEALISVRASGIGIAQDQLAHIFNMFTQLNRAVGRGYGGLGIGLTMARGHGGKVTAHSTGPGQGSEFTIRLLLANMAGRALSQNPLLRVAGTAPLFGHRILVVDDNQDAADSLGMLLEVDGAMVDIVYDGRSALASVENFQPHAVLLDIGMPGMDGYEVAQAIRQAPRFDGIRLIALTGWG